MEKLKEELSHPDSRIIVEYSINTRLFYADMYIRGIPVCDGSGASPEEAIAELMEYYEVGGKDED